MVKIFLLMRLVLVTFRCFGQGKSLKVYTVPCGQGGMMRELVALVLLVVLIFVSCGYTPPENLTKLIEMDGHTLYCPVWSPAGKVYFIKNKYYGNDLGGELWVCDTTGENLRLLLDGIFGYLAISNDGSKLALTCGYLLTWDDGGALIIVDTSGSILDTIPTSKPKVVSARFSYDGNKIYYYACEGSPTLSKGYIYSVNIDGINEVLIDSANYPIFFDVTEGGRIIGDPGPIIHDLSPVDSNLLVTGEIKLAPGAECLGIHNLATQVDSNITVKPYKHSAVAFPFWAPTGDKIVFTAAECSGFEGWPDYGRLWILDLTK